MKNHASTRMHTCALRPQCAREKGCARASSKRACDCEWKTERVRDAPAEEEDTRRCVDADGPRRPGAKLCEDACLK